MSSSDDYHRHRLRTATKYFKVSLKPFQRLAGNGAEPRKKAWRSVRRQPHEERLCRVRGGSPEKAAPLIITLIVTHSPSVTFGSGSLPE